nr:DUF1003 domain-containing protein [Nostoc commune]
MATITSCVGAARLTRGQQLADKLANHVGSWKFLICQSTILAGWVGMNLTPGVPHWDNSPFIMLNLVFSLSQADIDAQVPSPQIID